MYLNRWSWVFKNSFNITGGDTTIVGKEPRGTYMRGPYF
jgi:hypothetical protein